MTSQVKFKGYWGWRLLLFFRRFTGCPTQFDLMWGTANGNIIVAIGVHKERIYFSNFIMTVAQAKHAMESLQLAIDLAETFGKQEERSEGRVTDEERKQYQELNELVMKAMCPLMSLSDKILLMFAIVAGLGLSCGAILFGLAVGMILRSR